MMPHLLVHPLLVAGSGPLPGTQQVVSLFNQVMSTIQVIGVPASVLAGGVGGLMQTSMWHSEGAHQRGKDVMRYGIYGLIALGLGPAILKGIAAAVGALGGHPTLPVM